MKNMQTIVLGVLSFLAPAMSWAHGPHPAVNGSVLEHLLAHSWPVLVVALFAVAVGLLDKRRS